MIYFPAEILHEIFVKLDLKERLECTLVCSSWYSVLNQFSLLYDVDVTRDQYPQFKDMLERLPHRVMQVKKLRLEDCTAPNFDNGAFSSMFPKLRQLDLVNVKRRVSTKRGDTGSPTEYGLTHQLALSNVFNRLKSLEIRYTELQYPSGMICMAKLKNMPVLECLTLEGIGVDLLEFEVMHSNLPSIKKLHLEDVYIDDCENPDDIKPATLITELNVSIYLAEDINTHIQFYRYMSKKYLTANFTLSDELLRYEENEYARTVYNTGIIPFYQTKGSRVDKFNFENYCTGLDAFEKFDRAGMKLKELRVESYNTDLLFLEELVQSQQCKYIQELTIVDTIPHHLHLMKHMEVLATLAINCLVYYCCFGSKLIMNSSQLIEACPTTLTSLIIKHVDLELDAASSDLTTIKYLELENVDLTPALTKLIEANFPKLSTLKLSGMMTENLEIQLPHQYLEHAYIKTYSNPTQRNGYLIKTTSDGRIQHYMIKTSCANPTTGKYPSGNEPIPVLEEEFDDPLIFKFTCASVKKLSLYVDIIDYSILSMYIRN